MISNSTIVKIDYEKIVDHENDLSDLIEKAYGKEGLGLLVIKNIPNYEQIRFNILNKGYNFTNLDKNVLKSLEKAELNYMIGWSKAKAYTENEFEYLTGSFYAKSTEEGVECEDKEFSSKTNNVWPSENSENKLLGFKNDFTTMGQLMTTCQLHLLKHLDKYLTKILPNLEPNSIYSSFVNKNYSISRYIIYDPPINLPSELIKIKGDKIKKNWTGWHRDFGLLTALTHPIYFDLKGNLVNNIKSGLLIENKKNEIIKVEFEEDEMIMQTGDVFFIISGGNIIATPHSVKITEGIPDDIYRTTFVNFFEPYFDYKIYSPDNICPNELFKKDPFKNANVFTQFKQGITYKDMLTSALANYYKD